MQIAAKSRMQNAIFLPTIAKPIAHPGHRNRPARPMALTTVADMLHAMDSFLIGAASTMRTAASSVNGIARSLRVLPARAAYLCRPVDQIIFA